MDQTSSISLNSQGRPEKTEEGQEINLAYADQGYHEMEFTSGPESELHEKKSKCAKNPTHSDFIPVKDFTPDHLPASYRDGVAFDYISTMSILTVRLAVSYTSLERPRGYPLYNRRGKLGVTAYGSGWVNHVVRSFKENYGDSCPCQTCKQSPEQAKKQWGVFWVMTAKHMVFDTSEAEHTKCNLFFDDDVDLNNCPNLEVVDVVDSDIDTDKSYMTCITHDEDVCKTLEKMIGRREELEPIVKEYKKSEHGDKYSTIAVVISHPHGLSKHITVGKGTGRKMESPYVCIYSAETCKGSSGAPVCTLGKWSDVGRLEIMNISHSGSAQKGVNQSTG